MATGATGSPGTPPAPSSADPFARMLIRLGLAVPATFEADVRAPLTKLEAQIQAFNNSTQFKDSFFAKMPGIKGIIGGVMPDIMRATTAMIVLGQASKGGEDEGKMYESMSSFGKLLVDITPKIDFATDGMGKLEIAIRKAFSVGILLVITAVIEAFAQFVKIVKFAATVAMEFQDKLNEFNVLMGGLGRDRIREFNMALNESLMSTLSLGMGLETTYKSLKGFISGGINPAIAFQKDLIATTGMLAKVTGEAADSMASFFATIMVGSKISGDNLRSLGNSFANINRIAEQSGVLASVSFGDVKEAVTSVGSALLIASNKGSTFTDKMTHDLISLTTLSKTLGVSISEMNGKFEEAGNLLSSPDSGFRALLAISGGASVSQMLNNQFDKTSAMLKVADTLERLNRQLGGNLNLMGQVAQQQFGISKEAAIKYATMTQEQKNAIIRTQNDMETLRKNGLEDAYKSVTGTLTETWEKLKNVLWAGFQKAVAGNTHLQDFMNRITDKLQEWIEAFAKDDGPAMKFIDALSAGIDWLVEKFEWLFDNLVPILKDLGNWFVRTLDNMKGKTFLGAITSFLTDAFVGAIIGAMKHPFMLALFAAMLLPYPFNAGALLALGIGAALVGAASSSDTNKAGESNPDNVKTLMGPVTAELGSVLSRELEENRKKQSSYKGLKDTDAMIGADGNVTLVGLQRIKLEEREDKLIDIQTDLRKSNEANTVAVDKLTVAIENLNLSSEDRDRLKNEVRAKDADRRRTLSENQATQGFDYNPAGS